LPDEQEVARQLRANPKSPFVEERNLYEAHVSGGTADRAGLAKALAFLRPNDYLMA
jgi:ABC-type histidine transport system ATPase subunit